MGCARNETQSGCKSWVALSLGYFANKALRAAIGRVMIQLTPALSDWGANMRRSCLRAEPAQMIRLLSLLEGLGRWHKC